MRHDSSRTDPCARSSVSEKPDQFIVDGDGKLFGRCTRPQAKHLQALHYVTPWGKRGWIFQVSYEFIKAELRRYRE